MKLIIAGSRFNERDEVLLAKKVAALHDAIDEFEMAHTISEIVSGMANGADHQGEVWANKNGVRIQYFPAQWDKFKNATGKNPAGIFRNSQMAHYADALIALWDGESPGTKHMISAMKGLGKPYIVRMV